MNSNRDNYGRRFVIYTNRRASVIPSSIPPAFESVHRNPEDSSFIVHSARPAQPYSFRHPSRRHGPAPYAEFPASRANSDTSGRTSHNSAHTSHSSTRHGTFSHRLGKQIRKLKRLFHSRGGTTSENTESSEISQHLPPSQSHATMQPPPYTTSARTTSSHTSHHSSRMHASIPHNIFSRARVSIPSLSNIGSRDRSPQQRPPIQFNTLSMLLQTVSISTLRRLLQNGDASIDRRGDPDPGDLQQRYTGTRLDRADIPAGEDTTFGEFLHRLAHDNLLEHQFRPQLQNGGGLSFFRAFRFSRNDTSEVVPSTVPIMIVGLVSVNRAVTAGSVRVTNTNSGNSNPEPPSQTDESDDAISAGSIISHTASPASSSGTPLNGDAAQTRPSASQQSAETPTGGNADNVSGESSGEQPSTADNAYRSWIIVVMAHHYEASDSVLDSMPILIDLLTAYISSTNGIINPNDTTFFNSRSIAAGNMDEFRNSLFELLNRHRALSRDQLNQKPETMCVFRPSVSKKTTWKERAAYLDGRNPVAYYNPGDRCPICLVEYSAGDLGRKLDCKHAFHKNCVDEWLVNENTCPICRAKALKV